MSTGQVHCPYNMIKYAALETRTSRSYYKPVRATLKGYFYYFLVASILIFVLFSYDKHCQNISLDKNYAFHKAKFGEMHVFALLL